MISVIGLGKAGLPLAAVIAESGLDVIGLDIDKDRVEQLRKKINPIPQEPGVQNILNEHMNKNFTVTNEYSEVRKADAHIVIVPLFIGKDHNPDFSILDSAFSSLGEQLKQGDVVVLETTVPVGTTQNRIRKTLEQKSGLRCGTDFYLAYSPERIMTGFSISRYKEFPKVVGGIDAASTQKAVTLYGQFCKNVEQVTDCQTAELTKIAEGVFRDVNIALANELVQVSEQYGVDFWEVREKARHQFCNILEPGNVGGHCIPVYPWFLIKNGHVPLTERARQINDDMLKHYLKRVKSISSRGKVGIIGLSYREGVKEKAYTRSIPFISLLRQEGYEVLGSDPAYTEDEIRSVYDVEPITSWADLDVVVLFNKLAEYKEVLQPVAHKVVDVKNVLRSEDA